MILRPIQSNDNVKLISSGSPEAHPLKLFLQNDALEYHQKEITKTYVLIEPEDINNRVWGYISLMSSEIKLNGDQKPKEPDSAKKYKSFPAVKIARLLVDKRKQKNGYGKMMLDWSVSHIRLAIMPHIGCRFLAVDSKKGTINFYEKHGFVLLDSEDNLKEEQPLMFLDLHKLPI